MYDLPTYVLIDNKKYSIRKNADYKVILGVMISLEEPELNYSERLISALMIFYEDVKDIADIFIIFSDIQKALTAMFGFIAANNEEIGHKVNHKLIDWEQDEKLIVSAVNNVAGTEIRALPYLHWWTFIGYYMAIGESPLSMVVGIRDKIIRGKKLEKYEQEFRRQNPHYFRWKKDEQEAHMLFDEIWNKSQEGGC